MECYEMSKIMFWPRRYIEHLIMTLELCGGEILRDINKWKLIDNIEDFL